MRYNASNYVIQIGTGRVYKVSHGDPLRNRKDMRHPTQDELVYFFEGDLVPEAEEPEEVLEPEPVPVSETAKPVRRSRKASAAIQVGAFSDEL